MIRDKYQSIQVETFEAKLGVEFPPEYLAKAQEELFKQLSKGKIMKEVRRSGDPQYLKSFPCRKIVGQLRERI